MTLENLRSLLKAVKSIDLDNASFQKLLLTINVLFSE